MFDGFQRRMIDAGGIHLNVAIGGNGPPIVLLHGYPQTHVCWHRVAPLLAERFTVVCPDLRGYGDSDKPPPDASHRAYSKRTMAGDIAALMSELGFDSFHVAGHDRGGRVARRLALDHPGRVLTATLLDIVPTALIYRSLDQARATSVWRYFFLIQPFDLPESLIAAARLKYLRWTLDEWSGTPGALSHEAVAEYECCFEDRMVRCSCEDYRAGATCDLEDDAAGPSWLACPVLALWSADGLGSLYDVAGAWMEEASDLTGAALDCGHFLPEERPDEVAHHMEGFISSRS